MQVRNFACPLSFRTFADEKQLKYIMNAMEESSCSWSQTSLTLWAQTSLPLKNKRPT